MCARKFYRILCFTSNKQWQCYKKAFTLYCHCITSHPVFPINKTQVQNKNILFGVCVC